MKEAGLLWHLRRVLVLSVPMVGSQLLLMAIGVTDSVMVARLGEVPLAQITLATQLIFTMQLALMGIPIAMSVVLANALARKALDEARQNFRMCLWIVSALGIAAMMLLSQSAWIFRALGQPGEAITGAASYVDIALWAMLPALYIHVFRNFLVALEHNNILMLISFLGFLANILGNYALIFGHFGFPALGLVGSAYATLITHIVMLIALMIILIREPIAKKAQIFGNLLRPRMAHCWHLLKLGIPVSTGLISEVAMFQFGTIMIGWIGVSELAAHGIVLQIAGLTFMIPLGISIVASVRAGNALGSQDRVGLVRGASASMIWILGVMIATATLFVSAPEFLIGLFLDEAREDSLRVAAIAVGYLMIAAAFQIVDGAQAAFMGLLRGLQDTFIPALLAFFGYWVVGVQSGYWLAFHFGFGGQGVWAGLALGLLVTAILLGGRFIRACRPEYFRALSK